METMTFTLKGEAGKCLKCRIKLHAGDKVTIDRHENGSFDYRHFECPPLADNTGTNRVIQGAK